MSLQNTVTITDSAKRTVQLFREFPQKVLPAIQHGMNRANNWLLAKVLPTRFSGAGPFPVEEHRLGERTGHLYDSIRATDAEIIDQGVTSGLGSNLVYFGVHEFGFNGQVHVAGHLRRIVEKRMGGKLVSNKEIAEAGALTKKGKIRKGRVDLALKNVIVDDFVRWMQMPARSPLQTGIEENLDGYGMIVSDVVIEELGEYAA